MTSSTTRRSRRSSSPPGRRLTPPRSSPPRRQASTSSARNRSRRRSRTRTRWSRRRSRAGVKFAMGYQPQFGRVWPAVKHLIDEGVCGRLMGMSVIGVSPLVAPRALVPQPRTGRRRHPDGLGDLHLLLHPVVARPGRERLRAKRDFPQGSPGRRNPADRHRRRGHRRRHAPLQERRGRHLVHGLGRRGFAQLDQHRRFGRLDPDAQRRRWHRRLHKHRRSTRLSERLAATSRSPKCRCRISTTASSPTWSTPFSTTSRSSRPAPPAGTRLSLCSRSTEPPKPANRSPCRSHERGADGVIVGRIWSVIAGERRVLQPEHRRTPVRIESCNVGERSMADGDRNPARVCRRRTSPFWRAAQIRARQPDRRGRWHANCRRRTSWLFRNSSTRVSRCSPPAEELYDAAKPQAIITCADNARAAEVVAEAAARGVHVMKEKPMAATLALAEQMATVAARHGCPPDGQLADQLVPRASTTPRNSSMRAGSARSGRSIIAPAMAGRRGTSPRAVLFPASAGAG